MPRLGLGVTSGWATVKCAIASSAGYPCCSAAASVARSIGGKRVGVLLPRAPFSATPESSEATLWAATYGMFHWGPVGWALYCLPTLAISCAYYLSASPSLRLSAACGQALGLFRRPVKRFIDLLFIVGLLGSAATGLGWHCGCYVTDQAGGDSDDFTTRSRSLPL